MRLVCVLLLLVFFSCSSNSSTALTSGSSNSSSSTVASSSSNSIYWDTTVSYGTLVDVRDSQSYRTVTIGSQTWMAQNLNYISGGNQWCYNDSIGYCNLYGQLYDWATADSVCPGNWHLPDTTEWNTLATFLGGADVAGAKLKAAFGWAADTSVSNSDSYGFAAIPGGYSNGAFFHVGTMGVWWTATDSADAFAYYRGLYYSSSAISSVNSIQAFAYSVRCVKTQ